MQSARVISNPDYAIIDTPGYDNDAEDVLDDTIIPIPGELNKLVTNW
jgi:hypothetical protein